MLGHEWEPHLRLRDCPGKWARKRKYKSQKEWSEAEHLSEHGSTATLWITTVTLWI